MAAGFLKYFLEYVLNYVLKDYLKFVLKCLGNLEMVGTCFERGVLKFLKLS